MKIIIASNNPGKIKELQILMHSFPFQIISQKELGIPEVAETGKTFVENAIIKARYASHTAKLPALADDSGIIVPYLKGEPGIYSARYAGEKAPASANIHKLLKALDGIPEAKRDAYFYCVIVFMRNPSDPAPIIAEGRWHGKIMLSPKGENGFGYDPIFYLPEKNKTAAELNMEEKNKISHRGKALQSFIQQLENAGSYHDESLIR